MSNRNLMYIMYITLTMLSGLCNMFILLFNAYKYRKFDAILIYY